MNEDKREWKEFMKKEKVYNIQKYAPSKTSFELKIENNLKLSTANPALLNNPDRGYRGEVYITLGENLRAYPGTTVNPYDKVREEMTLYADDNMHILQCYIYLCDYRKKDLDELAFKQLYEYFNFLKNNNLRILMRFSYEYEAKNHDAKDKLILHHLDSFKNWIDSNFKLFNDVVYAVQFGLVGLWGEGHGSHYRHNIAKLADKLCEVIPSNIHLMVRTPEIYSQISKENQVRFAFHDDFLVGVEHIWGMIPFNHPQYQDILNKNQYSIADGEMPWGRDTTMPNINHILLIKQCVDYALTTLSLTHNYKEEKGLFHLDKWKNVYLSKAELEENHFPYNPACLKDDKISVYDYLALHLGYNIGVSNLEKTNDGVKFLINNFGMAAPHEFKLEIQTNGDEPYNYNFNSLDLKRFDQIPIEITDIEIKRVEIRFVHKRTGMTIALANDLPVDDETGFTTIYKDFSRKTFRAC